MRVGAGIHDRAVDRGRAARAWRRSAALRRCAATHSSSTPSSVATLPSDCLDVGERGAAVTLRLANAEQVEIRTVEDGDPHRCFNPCSQELNCSMSSALRSAGSPAAGFSGDALPPPEVRSPSAFCEKNWSNEKPCDVARSARASFAEHAVERELAGRRPRRLTGDRRRVGGRSAERLRERGRGGVLRRRRSAIAEQRVDRAAGGCSGCRSPGTRVRALRKRTTPAREQQLPAPTSRTRRRRNRPPKAVQRRPLAPMDDATRSARRTRGPADPRAGAGTASARSDATLPARRWSDGLAALSCS